MLPQGHELCGRCSKSIPVSEYPVTEILNESFCDTHAMNNFLSSTTTNSSDDSVQAGRAKRTEILNTPLPDQIVCRIRGRSRVRVKSVGDLKLHMEVIEHLIDNYKDYPGKVHYTLLRICSMKVAQPVTTRPRARHL